MNIREQKKKANKKDGPDRLRHDLLSACGVREFVLSALKLRHHMIMLNCVLVQR
jgi:hypothetical protein